MGGFDLKTAVQAVPKMVDDLTELAKNGQDNKTKRYESDNKRAVELKKEGTQKILAAGQVVNNIGSAANHLGSAYKNIRSAEGDLEKARAEATKAQAEIKKADAVLERAKNEKSKNDQEHVKNMHDIDTKHQEAMRQKEIDFTQTCQDNANIKAVVDDHLKTSEIYHQKLKDGSLSAAEADLMKQSDARGVEIVKAILEKRK